MDEKPAYKLTLKDAIPLFSATHYTNRNSNALEKGDERSRFLSKELAPRFALLFAYDAISWIMAVGDLEKIFN